MSEASIGVFDLLDTSAPPHVILASLERDARRIVEQDLVHRLLPHVDRLSDISYDAHPWAALAAGAALCGSDRTLGRSLLSDARTRFASSGDEAGEGLACFVEGLEDLSEGRTEQARTWWMRSRSLLQGSQVERMIGAHLALTAFVNGDLRRAIVLGEHSLWAAQHAQDRRSELISCVVLALCHLATGRFSLVDVHLELGEQASSSLPESDRYEMPVLVLERAELAFLRGEREVAEVLFEKARELATADNNGWYEAIVLAARAERTGFAQTMRATADARRALDYFESVDETWWSTAARLGFAEAHRGIGNLDASRAICLELLDESLTAFDRGRTLLVLAEAERVADPDLGTMHATEASAVLSAIGADFWAAEAEMKLSLTDPTRAEFHRRRARVLVPSGETGDPAWTRVLTGTASLTLRMLGEVDVRVDGVHVRFATRSEIELLAMLALTPSGLRRSLIGDRLWPDDDPARVAHRVDSLISGLRKRLAPSARLLRNGQNISLTLHDGECDIRDALTLATTELGGSTLDRRKRLALIDMLRSPLLGGAEIPWLGLECERLDAIARLLETTSEPI